MQALKQFVQASASQISTFRDCPRKWWIEKVLGIKVPASQSQQFGSKVHEQLEHFVLNKIKVTSMMAEAVELIKYIPDKTKFKLVVEPCVVLGGTVKQAAKGGRATSTPTPGSDWLVPVLGFIDLAALAIQDPSRAEVIDWKTTKSFGWMPTIEELKTNPQTVIYCQALFESDSQIKKIRFLLAYTLKGYTPESRTVFIEVSRDDKWFKESLANIKEDVLDMYEYARDYKKLEEVFPDLTACGNYGGCPHKHLCPELKRNIKKGVDMGIFDEKTGAQPAKVDAAVAAAQVAGGVLGEGLNPPPLNAPATASPLLSQPPQAAAQPQVQTAAPFEPTQNTPAQPATEAAEGPKRRKRRTRIEIRRDELIEQCGSNVNLLTVEEYNILARLIAEKPLENFVLTPYAGNGAVAAPVAVPVAGPVAAPATDPVFVPINQRANAPAGTPPAVTPAQVVAGDPPVSHTNAMAQGKAAEGMPPYNPADTIVNNTGLEQLVTTPGGLNLFIGCKPNYPVKDLVDCLAPIFRKIETENGIAHWNQMEYGKGQSTLAALVNVVMLDAKGDDKRQLGLDGPVYYDGKDETLRQAVTVLKSHAVLVVE